MALGRPYSSLTCSMDPTRYSEQTATQHWPGDNII